MISIQAVTLLLVRPLTTSIDNFTGTQFNDTFNAKFYQTVNSNGQLVNNQTLNAGDSLNGNGGVDTINVEMNADVTPAQLTNIEVVNVAALASGTMDLGLTNAGQVTNVNNVSSTEVLRVFDIAAGADLGVTNVSTATTFAYAAAAVAGSTDVANLTVQGTSGAADIVIADVETINVTGNGTTNSIDLAVAAANTITFAGASNLTAVTTSTTGVELFDGRNATGKLTLTVADQSTAEADVSVYGGSGNDTLTITVPASQDILVHAGKGDDNVVIAGVASTDTISGGEGIDTLSLGAAITTSAVGARFTEFETLALEATGGSFTQNMAVFGATTFTRVNNTNTANTVTVTNAADTLTTVGLATGSDTVFSRATDGSANALTVALVDGATANSLTANDEETVTVTSNRTSATTSSTRVSGAVTTLNASDLTTFIVTGTENLGATDLATSTKLASVTSTGLVGTLNLDASASTVNMTANLGNGASTLTAGSGNDVINGGAGNDSLYGGAGNDSITGGEGTNNLFAGTGSDTVIGGTGTDTFTFNSNELSNGDSIVGGLGNDTLVATLGSGAVTPASIAGVETYNITSSGGSLNLANATGATTLNSTTNASTAISNIAGTVTAVNQITNAANSAVNYGYQSGAAATVTYALNAASTGDVTNGGTTFSNVQTLTVSGDNDGASDFILGTLNAGSAATSVTLMTETALNGADADNGLYLTTITGSGIQTLTVNANAAEVIVGDTAASLAALTTLNLNSTTSGGVVDFLLGEALTAAKLSSLTVNANTGNISFGDIGTTSAESTALTKISITATNGADIETEDLLLGDSTTASTLNTVTLSGGDETNFVMDKLVATGAAIGSYALTAGNFASAATSTFGNIEAASISQIDVVVGKNGTYNVDGVNAATIGNVNLTVGSGSTVDFTANSGTFGAEGGTVGNITIGGAGSATLTAINSSVGLVSVGLVDTSAGTGTYTINLTGVDTGTNMTGGDGVDKFTGTAGADNIYGFAGADSLYGGDGADYIDGGAGNDQLFGDAGADTIITGLGVNSVTGGAGNDAITLSTSSTNNVLTYNNKAAAYIGANADTITGVTSASAIFKFIDSGTDLPLNGTATLSYIEGSQADLKAATIGTGVNVFVITSSVTQTGEGVQAAIADIALGSSVTLGTTGSIWVTGATGGNVNVWWDASYASGDAVLLATTDLALTGIATLSDANFLVSA